MTEPHPNSPMGYWLTHNFYLKNFTCEIEVNTTADKLAKDLSLTVHDQSLDGIPREFRKYAILEKNKVLFSDLKIKEVWDTLYLIYKKKWENGEVL